MGRVAAGIALACEHLLFSTIENLVKVVKVRVVVDIERLTADFSGLGIGRPGQTSLK